MWTELQNWEAWHVYYIYLNIQLNKDAGLANINRSGLYEKSVCRLQTSEGEQQAFFCIHY